jgi:hypothetical protein
LDVLSALKSSIVVVRAAFLCLAHALVIAMAGVNGDPKHKSYRNGRSLQKPVEELLKVSGFDLFNSRSLEEIRQFQKYLSDCKIIVFDGLSPNRLIFSGNSTSAKKLCWLYDSDNGHFNVITNIKAAMAKRYICKGCDSLYDHTHKRDKVCSLFTATPPCTKDQTKYCSTCNRYFLSEKCFQNHLSLKMKGKLVCQWRKVCPKSSYLVTGD